MQSAVNEQSCSALRIPIKGYLEKRQARKPGVEHSAGSDLEPPNISQRRINMLWTICVVLVILWLLGFTLHVGGGLIHLLLVVALVVLVINLLSGRRGIA